MGEIVWVEQEDGNKRLAVELCFDLVKYRFCVKELITLRYPRPKVDYPPQNDPALDDITYYLTDGGQWIKQWYYENALGNDNEGWGLAHPVNVARDYLFVGREPHVSIGAERVEIARDYERYMAWRKGPEYRMWRDGLPQTAISGTGQGPAPGVSSGVGKEAAASKAQGPPPPRPRWDRENMELFFGDTLCRRYPKYARNQFALLDAFEEEGWPEETIKIPFENKYCSNEERLKQTIKDFNRVRSSDNKALPFRIKKVNLKARWGALPRATKFSPPDLP